MRPLTRRSALAAFSIGLGLGTRLAPSADLISYLLFDSDYTNALIDLGYKDAERKRGDLQRALRRLVLRVVRCIQSGRRVCAA